MGFNEVGTGGRRRSRNRGLVLLAVLALAALLAGCGSDDGSSDTTKAADTGSTTTASTGAGGDWCGPKEITLGIQDGGGLNGWSKESLKQVKLEAAKCPQIKKTIVVNAGFDPQKAISGLTGLVAQGSNAVVIIPDAGGPAELPGIRSATQRGVKVVPWAADPTGTPGKDFVDYVDWDTKEAGKTWGTWLAKQLDGKGNVIFLGGPAGNAVDTGTLAGAVEAFKATPGIKVVTGDTTPAVANWDPAQTQKVTAGLITKNPQIDGIIVADGQSAAGAVRAFKAAGKKVPPIATLEANEIACDWKEAQGSKDAFPLATISARNWLGRYAVRKAVAAANGNTDPSLSIVSLPLFEDSEGGTKPICKADEAPDSFFSNLQTDDELDQLMQK